MISESLPFTDVHGVGHRHGAFEVPGIADHESGVPAVIVHEGLGFGEVLDGGLGTGL